LIYFAVYLFIEVLITVNIASKIGALATFLEIVFSALFGFFLLRNTSFRVFESMRALAEGEITMEEFQRLNLFSIIGAFLLIIPGFFSDILGVLFQFSSFGTLFAKKILHLKSKNRERFERDDLKEYEEEIIDVEIIEEKKL